MKEGEGWTEGATVQQEIHNEWDYIMTPHSEVYGE